MNNGSVGGQNTCTLLNAQDKNEYRNLGDVRTKGTRFMRGGRCVQKATCVLKLLLVRCEVVPSAWG